MEADGEDSDTLLKECQKLLEACDHLVAAEKEILELSAETYIFAHEGGQLLWQH